MKKDYPKVSIVVVNFNGKKHLKDLFDSISKLVYPKAKIEVLLVDNLSTDDSVSYVKRQYPKVKIIKNNLNNYCKAINLGIRNSKAEFVALVNTDVKLDKRWLSELVNLVRNNQQIAIAGSKVLTWDGKIQNAGHYQLPNYYWGERGAGEDSKNYTLEEEIISLPGTAVLLRKKAIESVGLYDEDFIIYGEDVEIALRLKQAGYKIFFVPTSIAYHRLHGSGSEDLSRYYIERNRLLFVAKHYPHQLAAALLGSGHFSAKKSIEACGMLYDILPDVLKKLINEQSSEIVHLVIPGIFAELKKIISFENDELKKLLMSISETNIKNEATLIEQLRLLDRKSADFIEREEKLRLVTEQLNKLIEETATKDSQIVKLNRDIQCAEDEHVGIKTELNNLSRQLRQSLNEILLKDGQIAKLNQQLDEQSHGIRAAERKISNFKTEIDSLSKQLSQSLEDVLIKNGQIIERDTKLSSLKDEIDSLSKELRQRLDQALIKDSQVAELNQQVEEQLNDIRSKEEELNNFRNEINSLSSQLRHSLDAVLLKDGQIAKRDNQISKFNQQIEKQLSDIKSAEEELSNYKDEINNLSTQLRHKLDQLLLKDGQIAGKDNQILRLNEQVKKQLEDIDSAQKELTNYKNEINNLSTQLRMSLNDLLLRDGQIIERDTQIAHLNDQIERQISDIRSAEEELSNYKNEINNLSAQLRQRLDEVLLKDERIISLSDELKGVYDSEGFRFVLRPIWSVIWNTRKMLSFTRKKLVQSFWLAVSFIFSPLFIILSLFFLLEHLCWKIAGGLFKKIIRRRKVEPLKQARVSLVMPNYNGLEILKKCLPSIFATEEFNDSQNEVIIVDDCSKDGSVEFIRNNFPQVRLIRNKRNRGFGFTSNRAVRSAKNEIVVLLNNDIMITKDFLKPLLKHLDDQNTFVVTPKLYGWDKEAFNWGMHIGHFKNGHISLWNEAEIGQGDKINRASPSVFAIGGAMVFRKSDFIWLGGFDSIYRPNCWEDIDISYRAWKRGLKVVYEPNSLIYHKARATLSYERPKEIKNELLFTWRNITDTKILKNHLNMLPWNLYYYRMNYLRGFLWAFDYLPQVLLHRFLDRRYEKTEDKKILNQCMLYYRNFERRGHQHAQSNQKKSLLLITPFMPYPLNTGGKIRIHTLAKLLSTKYDISLLTLVDSKDEEAYIPELEKTFKQVHTVFERTRNDHRLYPKRYQFTYSQFLIDKLREIQSNQPIDLIQIESNELLYLVDYVKYIPIIYTEHDSSLMFFKDSYYAMEGTTLISHYFDYLKRVRFHSSVYKNLDKVILLSKEDDQVLRAFFPKSDFSFIPTGVDIEHFSFVHLDRPKSKRLIYVGHYPHYPNQDAVVYFAKRILPRIRRRIPDIEFLIVGSSPTKKVRELSHLPNIRLISDVEDVYPYLKESAIFVNPIRLSAGIKGKVLEAMASGIPVVSTTVGSSGIKAINKKEILIADSPRAFAKAIERLFKDNQLYTNIAKNARQLIENIYDWRKIALSLADVYEEAINFAPISTIETEASFDKVINLSNQIVEEAVKENKKGFHLGAEYGPEELHIELTYHCNSQCVMCDLWDEHKRNFENKKELSLSEIKQLIDSSNKLKKIKTVVLSGGEPFLRKDIEDICGYIINKLPHISLGILTNGINTKEIIKTTKQILNRYRPENFWLGSSLDGIGEAHDRIRGIKGAFSNLEQTIRSCKREGIEITLTFTLTAENFDQIIPAKKFADHLGIELYMQFVVPKEIREKSVFNFTPQQLSKIENDINKLMHSELGGKNYRYLLEHLRDDSYQGLVAKLYYLSNMTKYQRNPKRYFRSCIAGNKFAMLSPYGDLYFCPGLKNGSIGNIREDKFDNLWISKKSENIREFIGQELCHCWLVCVVFPVIDQARLSVQDPEQEKETALLSVVKDEEERIIEFKEKNRILYQENSLLNEQEYKSGEILLHSTPRGIGIGAHSRCNADCIFCIGGHPDFFDLKTYKRFFEKRLSGILPRTEFINLCGFGELLLMPRCEEFLGYINQTLPFSNKIITTNGISLSDSIEQRLIEGKYSLQVSLHASDKKLHQTLTRTEGFDRITNQIDKLLSLRRSHQSPTVNLVFVANTLNIENLPNFVEFAAKLGVDQVLVNYMTVYTPAHLKLSCFFKQKITNKMFELAKERAEKFNIALSLPSKFGDDDLHYPRCHEPWEYLYVETEGSILPCCFAGAHIGYLYRDEFEDVWNGEFYKKLRKSLVKGEDFAWCKYCQKNKSSNINDIRAHVSFRPDLQQSILKGVNLK